MLLLVFVTIVLFFATKNARAFENCITDGQWRVVERTTARIPTDVPGESLLKWDWHMECVSNPSIDIVYRHDRPTAFQIDQIVDWSPK